MVLGKKVAICNWEWGRNSVQRDGQKIPSNETKIIILAFLPHSNVKHWNILNIKFFIKSHFSYIKS